MSLITPIDMQEILAYMPHRFPFLLLDKISSIEPGESIQVIKNTSINEPFYQGHFPENPVFPGVLILESMAQAAGLLVFKTKDLKPRASLYMYAGVSKARFKSIVYPGDQMVIDVRLKTERRNVVFLSAKAMVGDTVVCEAELTIVGIDEADMMQSISERASRKQILSPVEQDPISGMGIQAILKCLPHRAPFLLIDRVLSISDKLTKIQVLKSTTVNEPFYQGHFPEKPVFPGVMLLEAMAQTAGVLAVKRSEEAGKTNQMFLFAGIDNAKFKRVVQPGDQIIIDVEFLQEKSSIGFYRGKATVDGEVVCTAELMGGGREVENKADGGLIDPRAIVEPGAKLGKNVTVGPWTYIGSDVVIGDDTWIGPHVVIKGCTTIGKGNKIFQFASVGDEPQDISFHGEETRLEIGDNNVIRECCTIHRGTAKDRSITTIGNNNLFMAYTHIAHDCIVGSHIIFANNASLAGHVTVQDNAIIGAFSAVHQFCIVGSYSFLARAAMVPQDVPPYINVIGGNAEPHGINVIGLQRKGFSEEAIRGIKEGYRLIYRQNLTLEQAKEGLIELAKEFPEVQAFIDFINLSKRGIVR